MEGAVAAAARAPDTLAAGWFHGHRPGFGDFVNGAYITQENMFTGFLLAAEQQVERCTGQGMGTWTWSVGCASPWGSA